MRRRDFIAGLGGAAVVGPRAAWGQQVCRMRRVGVLENAAAGDPDRTSLIEMLRQRLRELGWDDGRNMQIEVRWDAGEAERLRAQAAELVRLMPDVLFGASTPIIAVLRQASQTVPIVFVNANDPIRFGFVQNLAHPGGNITGFISWDSKMGGKWLELLKELAPGVARVGRVYSPQTYTGQQDESLLVAAPALAVTLTNLPFREASEIERGIEQFAHQPNSGLLVLPDASTLLNGDLIVGLATRYRMPAIYPFRAFIASGGLAYYGPNTGQQYRQAAEYVDRILRGAKAADLPVQTPTRYELVISLKAAKAINHDIPPILLTRADEVIE